VTTATRPAARPEAGEARERLLPAYLLTGVAFGIVLTKGELASWFRIQEALRLDGAYLYEVFAAALAVAIPAFAYVKRRRLRSLAGEPVAIPPKAMGRGARYVLGGSVFGLGWGITGVCPGPLFALLGAGVGVVAAMILGALAGTWVYGYLRPKLPH